LGIHFVQPEIFPIWSTSLLLIVLYTPVLKKICVIKNITVASVIAMTIPFLGWATTNPMDIIVENSELMWQTTRIVFTAALYNEILLDISDIKGDAIAGITTLPVFFGKFRTVQILTLILIISECGNIRNLVVQENISNSMFFAIIVTYIPLYVNLWNIHYNNYQYEYIQEAISSSSFTLLLYLIFCS
jgi:4-hydroxybenzoate polyprenyltransferase